MTKTTVLATVLLIGATASGIGAATNNKLQGSDTLKDFTRKIIPTCAGATTLIYTGGGSGTAEAGMIAQSQEIGPMSRFFNANACKGATPKQAQGHTVAFDGMSISSDADNTQCASGALAFTGGFDVTDTTGAPVVNCPGCDLGTSHYTLKGTSGGASDAWKDVLRLIYSGIPHTGGNIIANQNCASDARRILANNYSLLFQGGCTTGACTQLNHAFRRDDLSGTTDTMITLLGLPAITSTPNPFCNGDEQSDNDPIRRACTADDDVCSKDGKLGLVLPIFAPPDVDASVALYTTAACSATNKLKILPCQKTIDAGGVSHFQCADRPDGDGFNIAGGNLTPVTDAGAPCICDTDPTKCKSLFTKPSTTDHRVFNLFARLPNGNLIANAPPVDPDDPNQAKRNFQVTHAYWRLRSTGVNNGKTAATLCAQATDTRNIGCLSANGACSIGYSGRESVDLSAVGITGGVPGSKALLVNNLLPTDANVLSLTYPLSRKLFLDSLVGFANIQDPSEKALASTGAGCFGDLPTVQAAATQFGFVPLPLSTTVEECVDFDETTCNAIVPFACKAATANADCGSTGVCSNSSGAACATADVGCTCSAACTSTADCKGGRTCDTVTTHTCRFQSANTNSCAN
jgi:hypothetical protein